MFSKFALGGCGHVEDIEAYDQATGSAGRDRLLCHAHLMINSTQQS